MHQSKAISLIIFLFILNKDYTMGVHGDLILRCMQKHGIIVPNFVVSWFFFIDNYIGLNPVPKFWETISENLPSYICADKKVAKEIFDSHMPICWALTMDPSLPFEVRQSEYGGLGVFPKCRSFTDLKPFLIGFCCCITRPCYAELSGPDIGFDSIIESDGAFNLLYGPISLVNHECQSRFCLSTNNAIMQSLTVMENSGLSIKTTVCGVTSNLDVSENILDLAKTRDTKELVRGEEFLIAYDQDSVIEPKIIPKSESSLFICRCKVCYSVGKKRGLLSASLLTTKTASSSVVRTVFIDFDDRCAVNSCTSTVVHRDPYISPRNLSCRCSNHLYVSQADILDLNKKAGLPVVIKAPFQLSAVIDSVFKFMRGLFPKASDTDNKTILTSVIRTVDSESQDGATSTENTPLHQTKSLDTAPLPDVTQDLFNEDLSFNSGHGDIQRSLAEHTKVERITSKRQISKKWDFRNPDVQQHRQAMKRKYNFN